MYYLTYREAGKGLYEIDSCDFGFRFWCLGLAVWVRCVCACVKGRIDEGSVKEGECYLSFFLLSSVK